MPIESLGSALVVTTLGRLSALECERMAEKKESSVLFSLKELRRIENDRVTAEKDAQQAKASAAEQAHQAALRRKEDAAQRAVQEEKDRQKEAVDAQERAEREARL